MRKILIIFLFLQNIRERTKKYRNLRIHELFRTDIYYDDVLYIMGPLCLLMMQILEPPRNYSKFEETTSLKIYTIDDNFNQVLHLIAKNGSENEVRSLYERGAILTLESNKGTPKEIAFQYGNHKLVEFLEKLELGEILSLCKSSKNNILEDYWNEFMKCYKPQCKEYEDVINIRCEALLNIQEILEKILIDNYISDNFDLTEKIKEIINECPLEKEKEKFKETYIDLLNNTRQYLELKEIVGKQISDCEENLKILINGEVLQGY